MPGVVCWRKSVGIEKVGLYIPGGSAPLFSTILMLGIPAKIAGCKDIVLCTPQGKENKIHPAILYTAQLVGITKIFKIGGAQAIGAMAYGTETVPRVYKIFGPGNQYVTCAKQIINKQGVAIDMPAGPSEVAILADESCVPSFVAADFILLFIKYIRIIFYLFICILYQFSKIFNHCFPINSVAELGCNIGLTER